MFNLKHTALQVAIMRPEGREPRAETVQIIRDLLQPQDKLIPTEPSPWGGEQREQFDLILLSGVCGTYLAAAAIAAAQLPCMIVEPYLGFHPYHAGLRHQLEKQEVILLPASGPEEVVASLQAVRASKALAGTKLLVVHVPENEFRLGELESFSDHCRRCVGAEIVRRPVAELVERAGGVADTTADQELERWYAEVTEGPGEMDPDHLRQVAKLYLAEKQMLEEIGAVGLTVEEIQGFLSIEEPMIMPNVTYGILAFDGYLACEEGDIEALTSELLLYAGLGAQPSMSNLYLAYRDRFNALSSHTEYTHEMELADFRQCLEDSHVTAAHFSTSGVLPPNMMEEDRYRIRETLPAWPGQSMVSSTPKLGPVVIARLSGEGSAVHLVPGEIDGLGLGDQYGWYRGRYFIKLPSVGDFIHKCVHHHYAVGPENGRWQTLQILADKLLELDQI